MEEGMTTDAIRTLFKSILLNPDDATVTADLSYERSRQGELTMRYGHVWAKAGRMRQQAERQVKRVRAQVELEYRSGKREPPVKITEASIKAMVDSADEVEDAEEAYAEATYWYNISANYDRAISQRMELIRYMQQEQ